MRILFIHLLLTILSVAGLAQKPVPVKPRIIISTDIGGTDPDDNQSMIHFLMYADLFETEGLISSPSYGEGSKRNILEMIDLYEKDLPRLRQHSKGFPSADALRAVCKQGQRGAAPLKGHLKPNEGSDWIIKCAKKESSQPLWVLVWGGLEDVAQALHDDPSIQNKIKVYWIGGPNKKWSANAYAYIAANFPNLWIIEANGTYRGLFPNGGVPDSLSNENYQHRYIRNAGHMGKDFKKYYKGEVKMGDTPSLLYMMDGDPNDPLKESWGGSFERLGHSPRELINVRTTRNDTIRVYSVVELRFYGPETNFSPDSSCFTMIVKTKGSVQKWPGYYVGEGIYKIFYAPKQTELLSYTIESKVPGFNSPGAEIFVSNVWPGTQQVPDYELGPNWYTDRADPALFDGTQQGAKTVVKWRSEVLLDWAKRWKWLQ